MYLRAPFIWTSDQPADATVTFRSLISEGAVRRDTGVNRWVVFRHRFDLPSVAGKADVNVTVDGRYRLYVNGKFIGRGPCRSSPAFQRVDNYDIAQVLQPGRNAVAMLVHVYGTDMAWYETAKDVWQTVHGDGALYFDAQIRCEGEHEDIAVRSGADWRWREGSAWRRDTPRSGWGQDFIEDFDANVMPVGWSETDFDDAAWQHCIVQSSSCTADDLSKGWGPVKPFPTLVAREIPHMLETPVSPVKILGAYGVVPQSQLPIDRRLFDETLIDLPKASVEDAEALLANDDRMTTIRTHEGCDVSLLIAFDQRHCGFPFIELDASGGEIIELAVSETIPGEYGLARPGRPRVSRETYLDCAHLFRYVARPGVQRFQKFEWTAVKYVQLVVRNAPRGIRIRHVGSIYFHYPVENQGAFECSSDVLNRLWTIGRYTTLECTHDAFEDCPSREKRQWLGDAYVHYLINAAAFGTSTQAIDRQSIIQATEGQRPDGLMQMFAPGDHYTNGIIIPDFNLHWVFAVHQYFMHTGDIDLVESVFPAMQRTLAWFERQVGPKTLLADLPYWHFIEWAHVGREGEAAIVNAMFVGALRSAAALAQSLGYDRAGTRYAALADGIGQAINDRLWDEARGVYVDMADPTTGKQQPKVSQHANAAMILWDIAPASRWPRMIARIMDPARVKITAAPPVVPHGETLNLNEDVVQANTYFGHFLHSALGKAGRFDLALQSLRDHFRPMLDTGTETLWESFDPAASLCHAFSASAVYQLSAHALGVAPVAQGFKRIRVAPQIADLEFARGIYPTPHGGVGVAWQRQGEHVTLKVTVPAGCEAEVRGPGTSAASGTSTGTHRVGPGEHTFIDGVKQP